MKLYFLRNLYIGRQDRIIILIPSFMAKNIKSKKKNFFQITFYSTAYKHINIILYRYVVICFNNSVLHLLFSTLFKELFFFSLGIRLKAGVRYKFESSFYKSMLSVLCSKMSCLLQSFIVISFSRR